MKGELKPEDRALFDAGREGLGPTDEDRARVAKALGLGGGSGMASAAGKALPGSVVPPAAGVVASGLGAAKWIALVTAIVGLGAGEVALHRAETARRPSPPAAVASAGIETPHMAPPQEAPPRASAAPPASSVDPPRLHEGAPAPHRPPTRVPLPVPSPSVPPAIRTPAVRVAEEAHLLRQAEGALRAHDLPSATRWLDEHARLFPDGVLAEERDVQRVLVLCAGGRADVARVEASRFLSAHPRSVLAERVRSSCGAP